MKNPLDSLWGTVISGLVLTLILYNIVKYALVLFLVPPKSKSEGGINYRKVPIYLPQAGRNMLCKRITKKITPFR